LGVVKVWVNRRGAPKRSLLARFAAAATRGAVSYGGLRTAAASSHLRPGTVAAYEQRLTLPVCSRALRNHRCLGFRAVQRAGPGDAQQQVAALGGKRGNVRVRMDFDTVGRMRDLHLAVIFLEESQGQEQQRVGCPYGTSATTNTPCFAVVGVLPVTRPQTSSSPKKGSSLAEVLPSTVRVRCALSR